MDKHAEEILNRIIFNEKLRKEIIDNINFVEKYIDIIEIQFTNEKEKEIVYKSLGVIVVSCFEGLIKGYVKSIENECEQCQCTNIKSCDYHNAINIDIREMSIKKAYDFLSNSRFLAGTYDNLKEIEEILELRNCVHISKTLEGAYQNSRLNYSFVYRCLCMFYEYLDQLSYSIDWYFNASKPCIKEIDSNQYKQTKEYNMKEIKEYRTYELIQNLIYFIEGGDKENLEKIKNIKGLNNFNVDEIKKHISREIYFSGIRFKEEKEYDKFKKEAYVKLKRAFKDKDNIAEEIKAETERLIQKTRI